ncbi:hypothetical protein SLS54_007317 [Diplodia seriata]
MENVFTPTQWSTQAHRAALRQILQTNRIGPQRALQASLNEFRHWPTADVSALFAAPDFPPLAERPLYPLGPQTRYPPPGKRRWGEFAATMAAVGVADVAVFAASTLHAALPQRYREQWDGVIREAGIPGGGTAREQIEGAGREVRRIRGEAWKMATFVSAPLALVERAARERRALCVDREGRFRVMAEGYAAVSHVWGETMGFEFGGEKLEQDGRGMQRAHFDRVMEPALRCGYEWVWLDLLAIPKKSTGTDDGTGVDLTRLKTAVINTLDAVYRSAAAVVVLDALALSYRGADPATVAALLVCGAWLTRVWTYQEIKLARRAVVATAGGCVDFAADILPALAARAARDPARWAEMHKTFSRLRSVHEPHDGGELGINLADVALSCSNRSTGNNKDYARGFFALLGLRWDAAWEYEDGLRHIYERRPREAALVAAMHGPRGLPGPWSWAPRYLVQLQGRVNLRDEFVVCRDDGGRCGGLRGWWSEVEVRAFGKWRKWCVQGAQEEEGEEKLVMLLRVRDAEGRERDVHVVLWETERTLCTQRWVDLIPTGRAVMLAASEMIVSPDCVFPTVLLAVRDGGGAGMDADELRMGHVECSAVLVDTGSTGLDASLGQWFLK